MKTSLIIPTYNRGEVLCDTINMALRQLYADYEVIVVDQTVSYPSFLQERLDSLHDRIRYYKLTYPNLPAARNFGIRVAKGEIVIFVDDDVVIPTDFIESHIKNFSNEKVGGVTGLSLPPEDVDMKKFLSSTKYQFNISSEIELGGVYSVRWLNGVMSYRRKAIIEAGYFDDYFGGSGWCEDADLSVRVRSLGYQLLLDTKIRLIHLALPYGGCEVRNPKFAEQRATEQLVLHTYHVMKNRHIIGERRSLRLLFKGYRIYVLNRATITKGLYEFMRKHVLYARAVRQALSDLVKNGNRESSI